LNHNKQGKQADQKENARDDDSSDDGHGNNISADLVGK